MQQQETNNSTPDQNKQRNQALQPKCHRAQQRYRQDAGNRNWQVAPSTAISQTQNLINI